MKEPNSNPLLPHEWIFGFFLLLTTLRLCAAGGVALSHAFLYAGLLLAQTATLLPSFWHPAPGMWRMRLLFYPVAMNVVFVSMKSAIPIISPHPWDMALQSIDSLLIGQNLSLLSQSMAHPWLTELFSACYLLFFPYLLFSIISYSRSELELAKKFSAGLFTIYGLGFLGYSFVPASGPWKAMASQFHVPLDGWVLTHLNNAVVTAGTNGVDVFPSLHCAVSAFFLFFDREHRPWRFKLYLLPCIGLWLSTVYLRYHYFTDLICGFVLAAFALWLSRRYAASQSASLPHPHTAEISLT